MERVPWAAQVALPHNGRSDGGVCCVEEGIADVDTVLVRKGGVRAFPGCDAATATTKEDPGVLDPGCSETVKEICLARNLVAIEVCIS